jgi:hypothetical protein
MIELSGARVGPLDEDAIRAKFLAGDLNADSLLCREALTEWQHLKSMPEFAELVREAPRAVSPPAAAALFPAAALAGASVPAPEAPAVALAPPATPPQAPLEVMADPFATPPPRQAIGPADAAARPNPEPAPRESKANGLARAPAAEEAPVERAPVSLGTVPPALSERPKPARRRSGLPIMAYVFIALAAGFGGVGAYVLLTRQPPAQPQIVYVQTAAPTAASPASTDPGQAEQAPGAQVGTEAVDPGQGVPKAGVKGSSSRPGDPKGAPSSAPLDMSGFANSGVSGPSAEGPGAAGPGPSGGQLSAGEISGVVEQNRPLVKRKCWQPALDARTNSGAASARVFASLTIGPSGSVQAVTAGGAEKDFPGLASCIASRIKGWKFPASGGTTPVNVPFVFASQ